MVLPWVFYQEIISGVKGRDMGDIEFLAIKDFDGKLVTNEGTVTTAGDIASHTASSGKDMYVGKAKVTIIQDTNLGASFNVSEVVLKVNGIIKERADFATSTGASNANAMLSADYEFVNIGLKVLATQIIKIEAITVDAEHTISGTLVCFEETTGETPQIASI